MNYFNHLVNRRDWYNLWIDRHGDIEKLVSENLLYTQQLLQVGSWTYHLQKNSVFWSEGVCEILEIEPTALTDKRESFLKYVHPDDREHVDLSVQNSSENTSMEMDYRVITGKDNLKYIREKTFPELKGGTLRYDFYLPTLGILVEVDSMLHFKPIPKFHKTKTDFTHA